MKSLQISFIGDAMYRPTEIVADLRNATESFYHPMRIVGYWDDPSSDHACPQALVGRKCPHVLPPGDPAHVDYLQTVQRELSAILHIHYPHARVHFYLA